MEIGKNTAIRMPGKHRLLIFMRLLAAGKHINDSKIGIIYGCG